MDQKHENPPPYSEAHGEFYLFLVAFFKFKSLSS